MRAVWCVIALVALGCGDGGSPAPDVGSGGAADAPPGDAQAIACGDSSCDAASELCVIRGPVGPAYTYTCEPVPAGCEQDRSCACVASTVCIDAFDTCSDGAADDTVTCECLGCQ